MKKLCVLSAVALAAVILSAHHPRVASARPQYFSQFKLHYKDATFIEAAKKEAKCNTCHFGKKSKKNRNDYGKALNKHLTKDLFNELKRDRSGLKKKVSEALEAVEKEKSVSGVPFGKLMEEGKLPGTPPEEVEE